MKYEGYYYCPYCCIWIPADSPEVVIRKGRIIHVICNKKLRTKPRKPYSKNRSYPRVDAEARLAVTPVTSPSGGRP